MLTVHRQKLDVILPDGIRHEGTSGDKALLVGQRHIPPAFDGGQRRGKPGNAHHRVEHDVRAVHSCQFFKTFFASQKDRRARHAVQLPGGAVRRRVIHNSNAMRMKLLYLSQQQLHIGMRRQPKHAVFLRTDNIQALRTDRTCGAKDRDLFCHNITPRYFVK